VRTPAPGGAEALAVGVEPNDRIGVGGRAAGGLLVAYAILGLTLMRQSQSLDAVRADSAISQRALQNSVQLVSSQDHQQAMARAEGKLAIAQAAIPERVHPTEVVAALLQLADATNVRVLRLQNSKAREQPLGQHTYGALPFVVTLQGATPDLVRFLAGLERMEGLTLVIRSARLTQAPGGTGLLIDLDIFTRPPQKAPKAAPQTNTKPQTTPAGK